MRLSSYKNRKLKVKVWWFAACERKKRACFVPFILSEGYFFNICVLSQSVVPEYTFRNIHTFPYQRTWLHTLFCFFLKSSKAFSISLKRDSNTGAGVQLYYKETLTQVFSCEIWEFFRTPILKNICERLLLKVHERQRKSNKENNKKRNIILKIIFRLFRVLKRKEITKTLTCIWK